MKINNILSKLLFTTVIASCIIACKSDREEPEDIIASAQVLESNYSIPRFKILNITPNLKDYPNAKLTWSVKDSLISDTSQLDFLSPYAKIYPLSLKIESNGKIHSFSTSINVNKETSPYSKYISKIFDFLPAVGQFTNEIPEYISGNTLEMMIQKASKELVGSNPNMISLGGFGGYVVFGFDHSIPNLPGRDFKVLGNAFWANASTEERTGNCEPGIIMVAYDKNKNGKPDDDEWYEIAGSEYFKNSTIKNYSLTYYKPDENKPSVPGDNFWQTDIQYIKWQDNQGKTGYKTKNTFHNQSYYPLWISGISYTLTGTKIADNFYDQSGEGNYWVGKSLPFGYADNAPNNDEASNIDIAWAVDKNGNYVKLPGIDFVKIYTATTQEAGWLGEVSTEVAGAYDLHLK